MNDRMPETRRPVAARNAAPIRRLGDMLSRMEVSPNAVSAAGLLAALVAAVLLALWHQSIGLVAAAILIQLRLLANVLDGLVALEGGRGNRLGPLWNELPDRAADVAILVSLGIAGGAPALGMSAALLALSCAYVRVFGGSLGQAQKFCGPMAKQQRMATVTLACVVAAGEIAYGHSPLAPAIALWIIIVGTSVTILRRIIAVARGTEARG